MESRPLSPASEDERASAHFELRYEDLTQGGQVKLTALQTALGRACFAGLWVRHPLLATYQQGIVPILSRMVIEGSELPTHLGSSIEAEGRLQLAHEADAQGNVQGLVLNMIADVFAPLGRSFGAQPEGAGKRVQLGHVFAEHVFTKPFGPREERKVLRFDVPGQPEVPALRYERTKVLHVLQLPAGAQALDTQLRVDAAPWVFGLMHTDNNQHVNSLVYPRLFEEAALRRLGEHAQDTRLLGRSIDIVYRKPCFAGERVVCHVQTFLEDGVPGAVGYVGSEGAEPERAHCAMRLRFRRL